MVLEQHRPTWLTAGAFSCALEYTECSPAAGPPSPEAKEDVRRHPSALSICGLTLFHPAPGSSDAVPCCRYEAQIAQLTQQAFNMESTALTTENLRNTMATVEAMRTANKELKRQYGKIDVDRIDVRESFTISSPGIPCCGHSNERLEFIDT